MPIYTATSGIASTIDLLQQVNASIVGVARAPLLASMPTQINTADLPFALTWPSQGSFHSKGVQGSPYRQDRSYRVIVFVEPTGQSILPARAVAAATLLQRFIETYLTVEVIALADPDDNGSYQVTLQPSPNAPITDSGLRTDLLFGGVPYHGFEITVPVREIWTQSST